MKRAALTTAWLLFGCADDKDPTVPTGSTTATTASTGEPTTGEEPTGGEETGLEPTAGGGPFDPKILYVAGGAGPDARASWMNLDGSDAQPIASGGGMEYPVRWSRSGANALFNRGNDIWRVTPETGEEFNVTTTADQYSNYLDMSPDGAWVLFSGTRDNVIGLYRVRITGGTAQPLVLSEDQFLARYAARYSPDGQKIAYVESSETSGNRLFVANDVGEDALEVTGIAASEAPTWSPDSSRLAVSGYLGEESAAIFTFTPAGTGQTQITAGKNASYARWSPDGSRIAFYGSTTEHSGWIIGVVDPDGANETYLTTEYDTCYLPDWSPDGASLVFGCSDEELGEGIYTMVVDGGTPTMILSEPNLSWYPQWRP